MQLPGLNAEEATANAGRWYAANTLPHHKGSILDLASA